VKPTIYFGILSGPLLRLYFENLHLGRRKRSIAFDRNRRTVLGYEYCKPSAQEALSSEDHLIGPRQFFLLVLVVLLALP
jgi:hypothetical protein